ncbi:hypothetical protein NC653_029160 [Populus alba x Populus x berolinensis]|uniref:Uncharacterized protein n=1 Tax=Populus alba x Populus x berolinensis TaxID=444605 RepID=A0AAD6M2I6_9ROSI|nr:hypothetical protein NC653_029160 [Populus alba x Populus x berolinensis]
MDQLVADFISRMGLALPVAILVAVRAGRMTNQMKSQNMETKVTVLTIDVVKEKMVDQLSILLRVYGETIEDVNLPTEVNLQKVACDDRTFSFLWRPHFREHDDVRRRLRRIKLVGGGSSKQPPLDIDLNALEQELAPQLESGNG